MEEQKSATVKHPIIRTMIFSVSHTLNDTYPNLYPVLLPVLMEELSFSTASAAFISTVSALSAQLLQPIMGLWADRIGSRKFVVGGLIVGSILTAVAFGWAPTYPILLMLLLVSGLGNAAFHPHASALVGDIVQKRKGLGMSLFMIGGNFGRAIAPILAGTAFLLGGRKGLYLVAIPGLIMAVIMYYVMTPPPQPKESHEKIFTKDFMSGLQKSTGLLLVVALRNMTALTTLTFVPILWDALGYPISATAGLLSLLFFAGSIGNMAGGALSDVWGSKPVLIVSALMSSLWLLLFLHVHNMFMSYIFVALLGASLYATSSVVMVLGQSFFPENKGLASGLTLGLGNTLGTFGVALNGLVADHYSPTAGLYVTAFAILLSIPFVLRLKEI